VGNCSCAWGVCERERQREREMDCSGIVRTDSRHSTEQLLKLMRARESVWVIVLVRSGCV